MFTRVEYNFRSINQIMIYFVFYFNLLNTKQLTF